MKTIVQNFGEATKRIGRAVMSAASMRFDALRRKATKNIESAMRDAVPRRFTARQWLALLIIVGTLLIGVSGEARRGGLDA